MEKCQGEELDVICFPEYFPFLGERELGSAARKFNSYLIAGLAKKKAASGIIPLQFSAGPEGLSAGSASSMLERSERERLGISSGDGYSGAFTTDFGKIGIPVCIDFWGQPEAGRHLADQGVDIVFNISAFPVLRGHWKTGCLVRAFDNFMPVVGVNTADYNALFGEKRVHQHGRQLHTPASENA